MSEELRPTAETETAELVAEPTATNETTQPVAETIAKTEYEAEVKRRERAEYTLDKLRASVRENKRQQPSSPPEQEPEERIVSRIREEMATDFLDEELRAVSKDPFERERIRDEYENSIVKSGVSRSSIRQDLDKASKLVRSDLHEQASREMARTVSTKASITNAGGGSSQERTEPKDESWKKYLNAQELEFAKQRGWNDDKMKRAAMSKKEALGL